VNEVQQYFYDLVDYVSSGLKGGEVLLASFSGEESDFVRLNRSAVRQAGSVAQRYVTLELIGGQRHVKATAGLSGDAATDRPRLDALVADARERLPFVPPDPYLLYSTDVRSGERVGGNTLPAPDATLDAILAAGKGRDLVGILAQGAVCAGFANSLGQRNWFRTSSFHFDWSFYHDGDAEGPKAVKSSYAGFAWDDAAFRRKVDAAAAQLEILSRPARTVPPGNYRVYLAPAALAEILDLLAWGGFGLKAHRTKDTSLLRMIEGGQQLSPAVTIRENTRDGIAPNFQPQGYIRPDAVTLIEGGRYRDCLVSPRSARQYGAEPNGASESESPDSFDMDGGEVPSAEVLQRLGTGVCINHLWYLNYSDRPACRITGMTRFATFWVDGGRIAAPLDVMRFDETVYRVLGSNLQGLTRERDFIPNAHTYGGRSTESARVPGALVENFAFTL